MLGVSLFSYLETLWEETVATFPYRYGSRYALKNVRQFVRCPHLPTCMRKRVLLYRWKALF